MSGFIDGFFEGENWCRDLDGNFVYGGCGYGLGSGISWQVKAFDDDCLGRGNMRLILRERCEECGLENREWFGY